MHSIHYSKPYRSCKSKDKTMFTVTQFLTFLRHYQAQGATLAQVIEILEYTGTEQIPVTVQEPHNVPSQPQPV